MGISWNIKYFSSIGLTNKYRDGGGLMKRYACRLAYIWYFIRGPSDVSHTVRKRARPGQVINTTQASRVRSLIIKVLCIQKDTNLDPARFFVGTSGYYDTVACGPFATNQ